MSARKELYAALMRGGPHSPDRSEKASALLDAHAAEVRAEALREAQDATVAWLVKKASEHRSAKQTDRADTIARLADKANRGAVRVFLDAGHEEYRYCGADLSRDEYPFTCERRISHDGPCGPDRDVSGREPLVVSRFDVAMEPAPDEDPVLTIGAVAEDGRPVALLLDPEDRAKVARWLGAELEQQTTTEAPGGLTARDLVAALRGAGIERAAVEATRRERLRAEVRAETLREAANSLACLGPVESLTSAPHAWTEAVETLRRMAAEASEPAAPARVLPDRDARCATCGHSGADHHHANTKCWANLPREQRTDGTWGPIRICQCSGFTAGGGSR